MAPLREPSGSSGQWMSAAPIHTMSPLPAGSSTAALEIIMKATSLILSTLSLSLALTVTAHAESPLTSGGVVRIASSSIEGGWHTGRLHQGADKCWMVKLDKPTKDHYTMLSLLVVERLQLANGSAWSDVAVKPILENSPAVCREYGSD